MSDTEQPENSAPPLGSIVWFDMAVPNADEVRNFYQAVVGWGSQNISMGDYDDYAMTLPATGTGVAGICFRRGDNADFPPGWMVYLSVADLDASLERVKALGGELLTPVKGEAPHRYCVIRDPGGATLALMG